MPKNEESKKFLLEIEQERKKNLSYPFITIVLLIKCN